METSPKKLKIDKLKINKLHERNLKSFFCYFQKEKIIQKKSSNSAKLLINKRKILANQYNLTDKYVYSIINKSIRKYKTSLFHLDKNNNKTIILENLEKKNYINLKTIRKTISFKDDDNKYNFNNINNENKENKEENIINKKKYKTISEALLPFPIKTKKEFKKDDFDVLSLCGKGAYGTVMQVKLKSDQENNSKNSKKIEDKENYYAIKVIDIHSMKKVNKIYQIYLESEILNELNSPYIVKIFGTFQNRSKIFMVLEYLSKGNFATFLKNNYPLKEDTIKFYSAEIVSFLEYLQSQNVVHRDLKPENIMLNEKYHLQMIDFATVRKVGYYYDKIEMKFKKDDYDMDNDTDDIKGTKLIVNPDNDDEDEIEEENEENEDNNDIFNSGKKKKKPQRNKTFVGTAEYVSPEVISDKPADYGADLWAFGVILYQMYCGTTPFKSATNYLTFKNIEKMQVTYPEDIIVPEDAKDLINKILLKDPNKRLGAGKPNTDNDMAHLKKHPFFKGTKWKNLVNQNVPNAKTFKFKANKKIVKKINSKNKDDMKLKEDKKDTEKIKEGILLKKSFWFYYSEYFFTLDSTPRLTCRNIDKKEISEIINLNKKCRVFASKSDIFNLETPEKTYKFKSKQNDLISWINAIKDCIKKYGKDV